MPFGSLPDIASSAWDTASKAFQDAKAQQNPSGTGLGSLNPFTPSGGWLSNITLARVGLVILGFILVAGGIGLAAGDELSGAIEKVGKVAAIAA